MQDYTLRKNGGGAEGNRTPGLVIANDALSQLSYSPVTTARGGLGAVAQGRLIPCHAGPVKARPSRGALDGASRLPYTADMARGATRGMAGA